MRRLGRLTSWIPLVQRSGRRTLRGEAMLRFSLVVLIGLLCIGSISALALDRLNRDAVRDRAQATGQSIRELLDQRGAHLASDAALASALLMQKDQQAISDAINQLPPSPSLRLQSDLPEILMHSDADEMILADRLGKSVMHAATLNWHLTAPTFQLLGTELALRGQPVYTFELSDGHPSLWGFAPLSGNGETWGSIGLGLRLDSPRIAMWLSASASAGIAIRDMNGNRLAGDSTADPDLLPKLQRSGFQPAGMLSGDLQHYFLTVQDPLDTPIAVLDLTWPSSPISQALTYLAAILLAFAGCAAFALILLSRWAERRLAKPLADMALLASRAGDLSGPSSSPVSGDPLERLDAAVNGLVARLQGVQAEARAREDGMAKLAREHEHLLALTSGLAGALFLVDAAGAIRFASPQFQSILGIDPLEIIGQSQAALIDKLSGLAVGNDQAKTELEATFSAAKQLPVVHLELLAPLRTVRLELFPVRLMDTHSSGTGGWIHELPYEPHETATLREQVQPAMLLEQLVHEAEDLYPRHVFQFRVAPGLPAVAGDLELTKVLVRSLLHYVARLTPSSGTITTTAEANAQELIITIGNDNSPMTGQRQSQQRETTSFSLNRKQELDESGRFAPAVGPEGETDLRLAQHILVTRGGMLWISNPLLKADGRVIIQFALPLLAGVDIEDGTLVGSQKAELSLSNLKAAPSRRLSNTTRSALVIEDETNVARLIKSNLEARGFRVIVAENGVSGIAAVEREQPDLVLLDVALPLLDGFEVCRRVREFSRVPIIILSARIGEEDRIQGLNLGADDYLAKPFSTGELLARINAVLRRATLPPGLRDRPPFRCGDLTIDFSRREVMVAGKAINLTPTEYRLLYQLASNAGKVLTHDQLLRSVWGPEYYGETTLVWVNMNRIRKKLEPDPAHPIYLMTESGVGYRLRRDD